MSEKLPGDVLERLKGLLGEATKEHEICLNDPDYGEGGDPKADYCHLCWKRTKARNDFFKATVNALPGLIACAEALAAAITEMDAGQEHDMLGALDHLGRAALALLKGQP